MNNLIVGIAIFTVCSVLMRFEDFFDPTVNLLLFGVSVFLIVKGIKQIIIDRFGK